MCCALRNYLHLQPQAYARAFLVTLKTQVEHFFIKLEHILGLAPCQNVDLCGVGCFISEISSYFVLHETPCVLYKMFRGFLLQIFSLQ